MAVELAPRRPFYELIHHPEISTSCVSLLLCWNSKRRRRRRVWHVGGVCAFICCRAASSSSPDIILKLCLIWKALSRPCCACVHMLEGNEPISSARLVTYWLYFFEVVLFLGKK